MDCSTGTGMRNRPWIKNDSDLDSLRGHLEICGAAGEPVSGVVNLFLCGDVMTGRGVDQILPHPSTPEIFEPRVRDAREYVRLAELASGPIHRAVPPEYIWGDALEELARAGPDARIIGLETSVTTRHDR